MRALLGVSLTLLLNLPALASEPGRVFRDPLANDLLGPEMVILPAGEFILGDSLGRGNDNERPTRSVAIPQPIAMGRFEITFADWQLYADATGKTMPDNEGWAMSAQRPVIHISYFAAQSYCQWLSKVSGHTYRLPPEAEWEYAARAGSQRYYWGGEQLDSNVDQPRARHVAQHGIQNRPSGTVRGQRLRPVRHRWQCLGVDRIQLRCPL